MPTLSKLFFSVLLIFVAWLQLNDSDPVFWVLLYLVSAVVPVISIFNINKAITHLLAGTATILCLCAIVMSWSGSMEYLSLHFTNESLIQDMSPNKPYIEEAREFFGAMFALSIVLVYWRLTYRKKK